METKDIRQFIENLNTMDLKGRDLHIQYSILKNAEKKIAERVEEIGGIILEEMKSVGEIKKEFDFGKFSVSKRTSYVYSPAVTTLVESVKKLKTKEEKEGVAQKKEKEYLIFN